MNRRQEIQEESGNKGGKNAILDQLEGEVEMVVGELLRSREETDRLRRRLGDLEVPGVKEEGGEELAVLREENRELRVKIERIAVKAKEMLKRLDVIEGG